MTLYIKLVFRILYDEMLASCPPGLYGNRDAISLPRSLSSRLLSILIASRFPS